MGSLFLAEILDKRPGAYLRKCGIYKTKKKVHESFK